MIVSLWCDLPSTDYYSIHYNNNNDNRAKESFNHNHSK